jgi:hypothetical protein
LIEQCIDHEAPPLHVKSAQLSAIDDAAQGAVEFGEVADALH